MLKANGREVTTDQEKSNVLVEQFSSVFTRENQDSELPFLPESEYPDMPDITVSADGVLKLLQKLDVSKAAGPDQISNKALKLGANEFSPILTQLFQRSVDTGTLPTD